MRPKGMRRSLLQRQMGLSKTGSTGEHLSFDFDGLLVNTEEVHFAAYRKMCRQRGFDLKWSFDRYCQAAHYRAEDLKNQIYEEFPGLRTQEPDWHVLYEEKKAIMVELLASGAIHMMPGAEGLLTALAKENIQRVIVTHSPQELIQVIRKQQPILDTIPNWITRENYTHPKPNPECYHLAIKKFAKPGDRIVGFEDTPRGLAALMETDAQPVMISTIKYPEIPALLKKGVLLYPSLLDIRESVSA